MIKILNQVQIKVRKTFTISLLLKCARSAPSTSSVSYRKSSPLLLTNIILLSVSMYAFIMVCNYLHFYRVYLNKSLVYGLLYLVCLADGLFYLILQEDLIFDCIVPSTCFIFPSSNSFSTVVSNFCTDNPS